MSETKVTGGDVVAALLENCGVTATFGVISIHNLAMLDAIGRRNRIRFVPSRGEAGGLNMADGFARASNGLGVAFTSTGTGSGNAAGALVEALSAGSPVLHLTGQVDLPYLDRDCAFIHETRDQLGMLKAVSKAAFRVWSAGEIAGVLKKAVQIALTAPMGPVSVEIPIDVQQGLTDMPVDLAPLAIEPQRPNLDAIDLAARMLVTKRRPMLWVGGGARHASRAIRRLLDLGFGIVTSVSGRGVIAEDHAMTLGSLHLQTAAEALYQSCDVMVVAGSRLRSAETKAYSLKLPQSLVMIDADPAAQGKVYRADHFICSDAALALDALADRIEGRMAIDRDFPAAIAAAKSAALAEARSALGPYGEICDVLRASLPRDCYWVRDVTLANSTWGNRVFPLYEPGKGVHAVGGGIGQGLQMGIGVAIASAAKHKVAVLCGDGGLMLNIGELATAAQEGVDLTVIVMNDGGYGVIRNIQDARFGRRNYFVDLKTPNIAGVAREMGWRAKRVGSVADFKTAVAEAVSIAGPALVEVDMTAVGPYAAAFAGPPVGHRMAAR